MKSSRTIVLAVVGLVVVFLGFSYWYMMLCEGIWNGAPLEAGMKGQMGTIEDSLRADVSYLSETIGPRNPVHHDALCAAERWIIERWQAQGYAVQRQSFLVEGKECANLEIEILGTKRPSRSAASRPGSSHRR